MKQFISCTFALLCASGALNAAIIVQGNDPISPFGFNTPVASKVYDRTSGTLFVGLMRTSDSITPGTYAISRADRPDLQSTPRFVGIATDDNNIVNNRTVNTLALSRQKEPFSIVLGALAGNAFVASSIAALSSTGNVIIESDDINDAGGNITAGITALAASPTHFFALVRPSGASFGDLDSGVALVGINRNSTTGALESVSIKDAVTGLDGNLAFPLDASSTVLTGGTNDVTFAGGSDINQNTLYYDEPFDRFYIGVRIQTAGTGADIGKSVVVGRLADCKKIELNEIVANGAIEAGMDQVVVALENGGGAIDLRAKRLRVMHTSTGPSYLIVHGGIGTTDTVSNQFFALPLVDDPANPQVHGTLANKNMLTNGVFMTAATGAGELALATEPPAIVGAGPFPILPAGPISDFVVLDDVVYASSKVMPMVDQDTGVFYSQALFGADGRIIRWTPWKRATPFNAFPGVLLPNGGMHDGPVDFFDIDGVTGNAWIVEGCTSRIAGITAWNTGISEPNGLAAQANKTLKKFGSFSVLDVIRFTRGFESMSTPNGYAYALFGGLGNIVFALTNKPATIADPSQVPQDFTLAQNLLPTTIEGCVTTLEYSRRTQAEGDENFFFAGTDRGFYVFAAPNGDGFNVSTLTTLDAAPFTTNSWQRITTITGKVIDIKTSGGSLYLLTLEQTGDPMQPLQNVLYRIPFTSNSNTMFALANRFVLAQTGIGALSSTTQFFGMQIIATNQPDSGDPAGKEQLILATNQGLYKSDANQIGANGIIDAIDQTTANWQLIDDTGTTFFNGIGFISTPIRHTVWPFSVVNKQCAGDFDRGSVDQLSGSGNADGMAADIGTFDPIPFNAASSLSTFATLDPITYFWSDGGRRFFIFNRTQDNATYNRLGVIPYTVDQWALMAPRLLTDPTLGTAMRYYWVRSIGSTGFIMAGTNNGLLALR